MAINASSVALVRFTDGPLADMNPRTTQNATRTFILSMRSGFYLILLVLLVVAIAYPARSVAARGGCPPETTYHAERTAHTEVTSAEHPRTSLAVPVVDAVYTYVNGDDPEWRTSAEPILTAVRDAAMAAGIPAIPKKKGEWAWNENVGMNKFRNWDELRYSMRSIHMYAPWVRRIFLVVSGPSQVPAWLNTSHPNISIVFHEQLFDDPDNDLPTFNSNAIESALHRIPGLSNLFLYFNNDVLLGRPLELSDFITSRRYTQFVEPLFVGDWLTLNCSLKLETMPLLNDGGAPFAPPTGQLPEDVVAACASCAYGTTSALARYHFGVRVTNIVPHTPHLWERRVLYEVENALKEPLARMRRMRTRNRATDIVMHYHYEAWRVAQSEKEAVDEPVVDTRVVNAAWSLFTRFSNDLNFYRKLDKLMRPRDTHPAFICIDDQTLSESSKSLLEFHRSNLAEFFNKWWPRSAPWELPPPPPRVMSHKDMVREIRARVAAEWSGNERRSQ